MSGIEEVEIEMQEQPEYVLDPSDELVSNSAVIEIEKKRPLERSLEKVPSVSAANLPHQFISASASSVFKNKRIKSEKNERKWMEMFEALKVSKVSLLKVGFVKCPCR